MALGGVSGPDTAAAQQQQFLTLLVAQLRNQDPLDPVKQEDFLGQLAQFSTVEGVEKLNANFASMLRLQELTQGSQLLGRQVIYSGDNGPRIGTVDAVSANSGDVSLLVNGVSVGLDQVEELIA